MNTSAFPAIPPVPRRPVACAVAAILACAAAGAWAALPTGGQVAAGSASFNRAGKLLTVINTPGTIINWPRFSLDAGETARFVQRNAASAVLNRVVGQDPSVILGSLQSNGRVFLVNPNGIVFGRDATIDVAGLVASSLDIADADFRRGRFDFSGSGGTVANEGRITAADGGAVYLIAGDVRNEGLITAPNGDILLAAGHSVQIAPAAAPDMRVRIAAPAGGSAINLGELVARSGAVGIYGIDVTQAGTIDATTAVAGADGRIRLQAERTLTAAAGSTTRADGGDITLTSGKLAVVESGAAVRADAGSIKLWSDRDTRAHGSFRARGGFIETSGKVLDTEGIDVDARGGTWLLDPTDIVVWNTGTSSGITTAAGNPTTYTGQASGFSYLRDTTISAALGAGTDVIIDSTTAGTGGGSIQICQICVITGSNATLTLNAHSQITVQGTINGSNLNVNLNSDLSGTTHNGIVLTLNSINTGGGNFAASGSHFQGGTVTTAGGNISINATYATGNGIYLGTGQLNSGGGRISLTSASGTSGMSLYNTLNAGSGYVTLNLPNGGTGTTYGSGGKIYASGIELLGNNANYHIGGGPQWIGWTGDSVSAPGAVVTNTAQTGNPVLTVAGNLTGTSTVYLYAGTPDVAYVSGNGMNTDVSVGAVGGSSGLTATYVYLTTANGNLVQTHKITATDLTASAYGLVQGNRVDLSLASGNSVTNLKGGTALCTSAGGCTVGPSATPSYRFTNATALNIAGAIDAGNGAASIRTLTGNLTVSSVPSAGVIYSRLAGTAANYANAIVLVAGANTPARYINSSGMYAFRFYGANSRYVIYSKDAATISMGGAPPYSGADNGSYAPYFGSPWFAAPYDGSGLPGAPTDATKPNVLVFQVQPALNVTANAATRQYGNANPAFTYGASGFVLGDTAATALSGSLDSTATTASGVGSYPITLGTLASTGYLVNYTGANLGVTQRPLAIAADAQTKTYGSADPALTYLVTSGSVVNGDAFTLTRAPGESIAGGPYAISLSGSYPNYALAYTGANLSITPRPLAIAANAQTKVYGSADPALTYQLTSGSLVNGDTLAGALARAPGETVAGGPYAIGQGTLSAGSNYTLSYTGANLTVTPRPLGVTANAQTKVYGSADPVLTYQIATGGLVGGDTLSGALARAPGETVAGGPYAIGQGSLAAGSNYALAYTGANLAITPAPLTVTAIAKTKVYGTADPAFDYIASGFVANPALGIADDAAGVISGALARAPGENVAGGPYAITQGTLAANANYAIDYTGANLAITPAALKVTAKPQTKVYGAADPLLDFTATGLVTDPALGIADTAATVFSGALGRAPGESVAGGPYAIDQGSLAANANYQLDFTGAKLAITPAPLTVTASDAARFAGSANPPFSARFSGLQFADDPSSLSGTLTLKTPATAASPVGSYRITPSGLSSGNYTISYADGALAVYAKPQPTQPPPAPPPVVTEPPAAAPSTPAVAAVRPDGLGDALQTLGALAGRAAPPASPSHSDPVLPDHAKSKSPDC